MQPTERLLSASEAARTLGVSTKALRLYEERGLVTPLRSAAGWRAYGPVQMARAAEVAALRGLGFSLSQTARVLAGDPQGLASALATHQGALEAQIRTLGATIEAIRALRTAIAAGDAPDPGDVARAMGRAATPALSFALPWPWGGETFALRVIRPLTYIVGPLGSGKTRLARRIAETLPGAHLIGPERRPTGDPDIAEALAALLEDGATVSADLRALLEGLAKAEPAAFVIDMVEQGLDQSTQEAVIAHLRRGGGGGRPIFMMTRSSAVLDLSSVTEAEAILFCPANHSPPVEVAPIAGAPGYEAMASCLAAPEIRARTAGVVAWRPVA